MSKKTSSKATYGSGVSVAKMDSETERLVARMIMERAALLDQRVATDGVLSYLRYKGAGRIRISLICQQARSNH